MTDEANEFVLIKQRKVDWKHDSESLTEAVGVSREELIAAAEKFHELIQPYKGNWTKSRKFQIILENFEPLVGLMLLDWMSSYEADRPPISMLGGLFGRGGFH